MLRALGFHDRFRVGNGLEAELTRHGGVAALNANVEAFPDLIGRYFPTRLNSSPPHRPSAQPSILIESGPSSMRLPA